MKHFEPGQPVLFRCDGNSTWNFSFYNRLDASSTYHLIVGRQAIIDKYIIPYNDDTKHLLGTVDNYTEWKPKPNTVIAVRDHKDDDWIYRLFLYMDDKGHYVCKTDNRISEYEWQYATSIEESLKD